MLKRKCPYCRGELRLVEEKGSERVWACREHKVYEWKCGLCGRWGSKDVVEDEGSPTGHAHDSCLDRELIHYTCGCGLDELAPRGSGLGALILPEHRGHGLRAERTFKLGGRTITTALGRRVAL